MAQNSRFILDFSQLYKTEEDLIGKKAHELGELWKLGIPLPNGFIITTEFFKEFLNHHSIDKEIKKTQKLIHPALSDSIEKLFLPVRQKLIQSHLPQALTMELHNLYKKISGIIENRPLNIFSSSSNSKFISFSDIKGDTNLILKIKTIWSLSLDNPVAIIVQENIKSKIKGKTDTSNPIIDKNLTKQQMELLINYCRIIQHHFYFPQEVEYLVDKNKLFITKISPFTDNIKKSVKPLIREIPRKILAMGKSVNPGIATGKVKIINNKYGNFEIKKGEIIITPGLDLSLLKKIKNAKAVVVDSTLSNSLNKTLFRKNFHMPTIEGTKNATKLFYNGNIITVNGISGEIYSGGLIN